MENEIDRNVFTWVVVGGHRALYSSGGPFPADWRVALQLQAELEPLLRHGLVDVVFSGHYHSLEVTRPVLNQSVVAARNDSGAAFAHYYTKNRLTNQPLLNRQNINPVHVIVGAAGQTLDQSWINPIV